MQTEKIVFTTTQIAAVDFPRKRFVNFMGAVCAAGELPLGIPNAEYAAGEAAGVSVSGEILVEAGGSFAVGDELQSDADGRAIKKAAGASAGFARDASTGVGSLVRVLRGI